ncbi:ribonuclease III [Verrucomicrobiaceae bacterium N1E253]|uniref:Ribonuclease 3 n=1 Tax=Oceaniferula marina TaxID=2748318 RepID=A0A851GEG4_9BACT|nr:ribonuclease III [Oceaniferula marina]NWK56148.1 ribonuclease III [Oceaniferula marina]
MKSLEDVIGYKFTNSLLMAEALTHPSLAYETQRPRFDNQRLEFLGDAVIQLVLTELLYAMFPGFNEGKLTKLRARLVSGDALCRFARSINLGAYVMMGKGEEATGGRERTSTLADGFEALTGAIYLDSGLESARKVITEICSEAVARVAESPEEKNPKGQLQEILQAIAKESPVYEVVKESGPDHQKNFQVTVSWKGMLLAEGEGNSKKDAETKAAWLALQERRWEDYAI